MTLIVHVLGPPVVLADGVPLAVDTRKATALLAYLAARGAPLTELKTHSATLEDVFVSLTGRHLRDE